MSGVTLTIDERTVEAPAGATVFWAARKAGIEIPHLCYLEGLSPTAGCRLCVVEVEGSRNLSASCSLPVADKMVVRTDSPRVTAARRMVLEFLLSDHPRDCMTCEKSGGCELERLRVQVRYPPVRIRGGRPQLPLARQATPSSCGTTTSASCAPGASLSAMRFSTAGRSIRRTGDSRRRWLPLATGRWKRRPASFAATASASVLRGRSPRRRAALKAAPGI